ncbi:Isoflavone reductase P3 [Fusarium agapanthi]|uniref:Isoflavone reductase P3 n=1 Tax=Fusarium agapanthi TaxID=1803897 RepID=A0A9P5EEY1_9HYPO|nr:Isoflavone reductase P3 [Fusarium agapanthi]
MKVAILGATGETGASILNALLESTEPRYVRQVSFLAPSSLEKPEALALKQKRINVVAADLSGPEDELARVLDGCIPGDGNTPSALTDLPDVGRWVVRIIADPRTLNKMVFAYKTVLTMNQAYDMLEEASGEKTERNCISEAAVMEGVARAEANCPSPDSFDYFEVVKHQYFNALGIRGYNTPEYARYLGYVDATELYPDMRVTTPEAYCLVDLDALFDELIGGGGEANGSWPA